MTTRATALYIGGQWVPPDDGATYVVRSPIDGSVVAEVADAGPTEVERAASAARAALPVLRETTVWERATWCREIAALLDDRAEHIGRTVALETGRPYLGSVAEIHKAAEGFRLAAEEGVRLTGEVVPVADPSKTVHTRWYPTGVWAVLSPWNFPINIPIEYLGPLLVSGNATVWKPAPSTSVCASEVVACIADAGVPDGAINLLTTSRTEVASALVAEPSVIGVGLTGSTTTGDAVAKAAPGKRLLLELGGNGPILVFDDADLNRAAEAAAVSCFTAGGQICSAGGRVLAAATIAEDLAERVAHHASRFPVGDPFDERTQIGPLHLRSLVEKIEGQVVDAQAAGARVLAGGSALLGQPSEQYFPATVLTDVAVGQAIEREETFGPVVPVVPVSDQDDLITLANASVHALSTAVFTQDVDRALAAADRLEFGSVVINDRSTYWELHLPFGGWHGRGSGQGRVGVGTVLRQVCQPKTVSLSVDDPWRGRTPGG